MHKSLVIFLLSGLFAVSALAQKADDPPSPRGGITGNITDGAATFGYSSFGVDAPNSNLTGVGTGDQMFEYGWYFRVSGDVRETVFNDPDAASYVGDTATLSWNDVGARGLFSADETTVINEAAAGQGTLVTTMSVTNISGGMLTLSLFNYVDIDAGGSFGGDSATLNNSPDFMMVTDGGNVVEYRAGGNDFYSVAAFATAELGLNDADVDNFANTGLPFGPGDFTGGYQWSDYMLAAGETLTLQVTVGSNTAAPVPDAPMVSGGGGGMGGNTCASGGPDAFGYTFCDSNDMDGPAFGFVDISGTGTPIPLADDDEEMATIGFNFDFYGTTYTDMFVESNGFISFVGGEAGEFTNDCPLSLGVTPPDSIFPFWDDLDPGDDGAVAYTETFAMCPFIGGVGASGQCTIIQWEEFDFFPGDGVPGGTAGTFQAILFADGNIVYQYQSTFQGADGTPTIAISNDGGPNSLLYDCLGAGGGKMPVTVPQRGGIDVAGVAIQFAPPGVVEADLSITKTDSADPVVAGTPLTYTVTVDNAGPADANNVVVTDTLPAGVTFVSSTGCAEDPNGVPNCSLGTIASGGSAMYTITVNVDPGTTGVITNMASVTADEDDPNMADNSISEDTTVIAQADLSVTKMDSADPVTGGDQFTYTVTVSNAGPSNAADATVTDNLPAGVTLVSTSGCAEDPNGTPTCNLGPIAAGGMASYDITVDVDLLFAGTLSNTATVSSSTTDPNAGNNSDTEMTTVNAAESDLVLSLGNNALPPIELGDMFDITMDLSNAGPSDNLNVMVNGTLSGGLAFVSSPCATAMGSDITWNVGLLGSGMMTSCPFKVMVALTGEQSFVASAGGGVNDPVPANNTDILGTVLVEAIEVPTLNQWGLLLLLLLTTGAAALRLRPGRGISR